MYQSVSWIIQNLLYKMEKSLVHLAVALLFLSGFACKPKPENPANPIPPGFLIEEKAWGELEGKAVSLFILKAPNGFEAHITNYGATLVSLIVPDKEGQPGDVLLGFDQLKGYLQQGNPYIGCTVGRFANRIADARFALNGKTYALFANAGPNTLHGGQRGFDKQLWSAKPLLSDSSAALELSLTSPDGQEGYPGTLQVKVVFSIDKDFGLKLEYFAQTDKPTLVNLTNHAYFNLSAGKSPTILDHDLMFVASQFTPVNNQLIPTGKIDSVKGGPMDFTSAKPVGRDILKVAGGYDHNYVLDKKPGELALAAQLHDPLSGRTMQMFTTEPGVQFYSGNFLDSTLVGKKGLLMPKHHGLCLEAQYFPNAPNEKGFPTTVLQPGSTYRQTTIYRFLRD